MEGTGLRRLHVLVGAPWLACKVPFSDAGCQFEIRTHCLGNLAQELKSLFNSADRNSGRPTLLHPPSQKDCVHVGLSLGLTSSRMGVIADQTLPRAGGPCMAARILASSQMAHVSSPRRYKSGGDRLDLWGLMTVFKVRSNFRVSELTALLFRVPRWTALRLDVLVRHFVQKSPFIVG
jgi:hypothetical protein